MSGHYVLLKPLNRDVCLEETDNTVHIQNCTLVDHQVWWLESTDVGTFFIINKGSGYVSLHLMDVC